MSVSWHRAALALLLASSCAGADNDTVSDTCAAGLWGELLEEWALTAPGHAGRQGRVMSLPPTKGYYVTDRIDGSLMPPPPPPYHQNHHGPPHNGPHSGPSHNGPLDGPSHNGPYGGPSHNGPLHNGPSHNALSYSGPPHGSPNAPPIGDPHRGPAPLPAAAGYTQYDEWQASPPPPPAGGKIVNKPPNPYKDKFRPSPAYPGPSPNQPIPLSPPQQQHWGAADRLDAAASPPQKQVSETDLYLLSAIEKLVYRVDLMEKRLRRMEETMHYLVVGKETKPEPCVGNFTRVGSECYYLSPEAGDWKAASLRCRKLRAHLLELDSDVEKRTLYASLLADKRYKGMDFWTGGLNPGLLWIWAHSARPVLNNTTAGNSTHASGSSTATIVGEGRCLALVHDAAAAAYAYRGQDCSLRHRYVCELPEEKAKEKLSNEIERVARELAAVGGGARRAKVAWPEQ